MAATASLRNLKLDKIEGDATVGSNGFDELDKVLSEVQLALSELEGALGEISFDPDDPVSIEAAIQDMYRMVDEKTEGYSSNEVVQSLVEQTKEGLREQIIQQAGRARLASDGGE